MGEDRGSAAASGVALPGGRTASCRTHGRTSTNYIHMGGCGPGGRRSNLSKHPLPVLAFSVNARRGGSWGHSGLGGGQPPTLIEAYVLGAGPHRPQPFPPEQAPQGSALPGTQDPVGLTGLGQRQEGFGCCCLIPTSPSPGPANCTGSASGRTARAPRACFLRNAVFPTA